jgi:hypothetical protein
MSLTPIANLPPVSTTLEKLVEKFAASVIDTGVATGVIVSLIPVVHHDLRISPQIFEQIQNGPNEIVWGGGETDSRNKPEAKNLVTLSL